MYAQMRLAPLPLQVPPTWHEILEIVRRFEPLLPERGLIVLSCRDRSPDYLAAILKPTQPFGLREETLRSSVSFRPRRKQPFRTPMRLREEAPVVESRKAPRAFFWLEYQRISPLIQRVRAGVEPTYGKAREALGVYRVK